MTWGHTQYSVGRLRVLTTEPNLVIEAAQVIREHKCCSRCMCHWGIGKTGKTMVVLVLRCNSNDESYLTWWTAKLQGSLREETGGYGTDHGDCAVLHVR
ncbi:hypothetical protein VUR80DRAFT_3992 [Thermomyces stellatus]